MNKVLLEIIISGVLLGGIYSLFAVGISISFGVMKVFNVSYGALMTFVLIQASIHLTHIPYLVLLGGCMGIGAVASMVIDLFAVQPLLRRTLSQHERAEATFMTTLAMLFIIDSENTHSTQGQAIVFPTTHVL